MSALDLWRKIPLAVKILTLGLLAIATLVLLKPRPEPRPEPAPARPVVQVVRADPQTLTLDVYTQGTVTPRRQIDLISQVAGPIVKVANQFVGGGFFAAGDTLVAIDPRDYEYALPQAQARIAEAKRLLATERGLARQAQREWRDLGNAEANSLFLREPQIAAAEAQLAAAIAERDQARLNLERTAVTAPFAGRIQQTFVDIGQHLTPGSRIATIYDAALAQVRLPLTDQQSQLIDLPLHPLLTESARPQVTLRGVIAGQPHQWQGEVVRTEASLDPQSRMYYVVVDILEPFNTQRWSAPLLIGMYVEAVITGRPLPRVVRLPKSSLLRREFIYSLDAEQRVHMKQVRVLHQSEVAVWVTGDINAGEAVVVDRQGYLNPGVLVDIEPPQDAAQ